MTSPPPPLSVLVPPLLGVLLLGLLAREPARIEQQPEPVAPMAQNAAQAAVQSVDLPAPPPLPVADIAEPQPLRPLAPAAPEKIPETKLKPLQPSRLPEASPMQAAAKPPEEVVKEARSETTPPDPSAGRIALRLLEHGRGPNIEIAWPDNRPARNRLYDYLTRCLGMRTVLITASGRVFDIDSPPSGSDFDPDRMSGFMRQAQGDLPVRERDTIRRLREKFTHQPDLSPVRLFPRNRDAVLLAGLTRLAGADYENASHIAARYHLDGKTLSITDLRIDGHSKPGTVRLFNRTTCRTDRR